MHSRVLYSLFFATFGVLFLNPEIANAQYHLTEFGGGAGAGPAVGFNSSSHAVGVAAQVSAFGSHWVCGKSWGYHFDAGVSFARQHMNPAYSDSKTHDRATEQPSATLNALWFGVGASFKWRLRNYHRPREIFWMIGPVLHTRLWSQAALEADAADARRTNLAGKGDFFRFGGQASFWVRFPLRKRLSWFFVSGIEVLTPYRIQLPAFQDSYSMDYWQPFVRLGFTFWNNR